MTMVPGDRLDREELRGSAAELLSRYLGQDRLLGAERRDPDTLARLWRAMAEVGWPALGVPASDGGLGAGVAELGAVLTELGRFAVSSPFLANLLGCAALSRGRGAAAAPWLGRLSDGSRLSTVALHSGDGSAVVDRAGIKLTPRTGDVYQAAGRAGYVPDLGSANVVVVGADSPQGLVAFVLELPRRGVRIHRRPTLDQTRDLYDLELDSVEVGAGDIIGDGGLCRHLFDMGALFLVFDCVGGSEQVLHMTADHARRRVQFGRPIGSFQAVKHRCADMLIRLEASKVAADHAASCLSNTGQAEREISIAKAYVGDAYARTAGDAIQLHGGMGLTWDYGLHFFFKRAKLNQAWFGDAIWHRERVAAITMPPAALSGMPG